MAMVKKPLKTAIIEFYQLKLKKGKEYTVKNFKKVCTELQSINGLKCLKPLEIAIENRDPEKQLI